MAITAKNGRIYCPIGDADTIAFELIGIDGTAYTLSDGEILTFEVKKTKDSEALLTKQVTALTDGVAQIDLTNTDTAALTAGFYLYGFRSSLNNTLVIAGDFIVVKGVVA